MLNLYSVSVDAAPAGADPWMQEVRLSFFEAFLHAFSAAMSAQAQHEYVRTSNHIGSMQTRDMGQLHQ
jgi:hypothetical protein